MYSDLFFNKFVFRHIREDLEEANHNHIDLESMTDEELEFHYFQLHDFDNNTKLDGLEILQAIQHTAHAHDENTEDSTDVENSNENDLNYFIGKDHWNYKIVIKVKLKSLMKCFKIDGFRLIHLLIID